MFIRPLTAAFKKSNIGCVRVSRSTRSDAPSLSVRKRRIDSAGPSSASGGMTAFTRGAVRQSGISQRVRFVDSATDGADDPLDDLHQVPIVTKRHACFF